VTLTTAIDVVLSSTADTPTSTAAVLLILLLLILGLLRSQLSYR
jgi:MYXO-CTERM domain-containing protein